MRVSPPRIKEDYIPTALEIQEVTLRAIYLEHKEIIEEVRRKIDEAARQGKVSIKIEQLYKEQAIFFTLKGYRVRRESEDGMYFISWLNNLTLKEGV